ncbi:hypothetical protein [Streptomyces asiaticus]
MPVATAVPQVTAPNAAAATRSPGEVDNRATYIGFGLAYVLGHGSAALFLGTPGLYWVLAIAGGGAYAVATILERRRLAIR